MRFAAARDVQVRSDHRSLQLAARVGPLEQRSKASRPLPNDSMRQVRTRSASSRVRISTQRWRSLPMRAIASVSSPRSTSVSCCSTASSSPSRRPSSLRTRSRCWWTSWRCTLIAPWRRADPARAAAAARDAIGIDAVLAGSSAAALPQRAPYPRRDVSCTACDKACERARGLSDLDAVGLGGRGRRSSPRRVTGF